MKDPEQLEAAQDEAETRRDIDSFLADVFSDFVRTSGELHERLGRILDVALKCRQQREAGMWLELLRSQWRDCRLTGSFKKSPVAAGLPSKQDP